jgi:antitoxin ParD1/3/4
MNVSLSSELEQFIASKVASGLYGSSSEVIREGLRLLVEQDAVKKKRLEVLNLEIDKGVASLEAGRVIGGEDAYRQLVARRDSYKHAE